MSYNIDTFKVKKIEDLRIPISSLYKHERTDWHFDRIIEEDGKVTFLNMDTKMAGFIQGNIFHCECITCRGEGSGAIMNWILEPAFAESLGTLIVSCVWEGGDSINQLIVENGDVKWVNIDI